MKPNFKVIFSMALVASALFLASCGKDDDAKPSKTKTEYLTQHAWKFSEVLGQNIISAAILNGTHASDEFTFNADKTYTSVDFLGSGEGTWELTESESKIVLDGDETYTINKLDDSSLEITDAFNITLKFIEK